ncbi:hypothetical protein L6452_02723 [Arctium lappa]|uniref:Uncharacterized protein n=1 Tax=Arctium lappa TaxID=4217 RepID=A0ACB9FL88_ARCLA|nr:hypothetical protein L6452_02723 [Arctium lappa]
MKRERQKGKKESNSMEDDDFKHEETPGLGTSSHLSQIQKISEDFNSSLLAPAASVISLICCAFKPGLVISFQWNIELQQLLVRMAPDRSWISVSNRLSTEYRQGVEEFVGVAKNHLDYRGHLFVNGIQLTYQVRHYHGESLPSLPEVIPNHATDEMADVLADIFAEDNTYGESSGNAPESFNDPPLDDTNNQDKMFLLLKEMSNVEETAISSDIPILQEINSSELQLWVELPILDNVRYDRDDINPTEVHNVNELLRTSSTQFVVDDDEDEENEAEYEDEQEDVLVDSDSD